MLEYLQFLLVSYAVTAIFIYGSIAEPVRDIITWKHLKKMTTCPMCLGFWVACFFHIWLFPPATIVPISEMFFNIPLMFRNGLGAMYHGVISSGITWMLCTVTESAMWSRAHHEYKFKELSEAAKLAEQIKKSKEVELYG